MTRPARREAAVARPAKALIRLAVVSTVVLYVMAGSAVRAIQQGPAWFWFATCGGPAMTLEVHVGGTTAYKSTFPLCHAERGAPAEQGLATRAEFMIRPTRPIRWTGYRDVPERTAANQPLRMDLWQAGADPDAVLIGVSVMDRPKTPHGLRTRAAPVSNR